MCTKLTCICWAVTVSSAEFLFSRHFVKLVGNNSE